jgi:hypothetical protein
LPSGQELELVVRNLATIVIHWKDKNLPPMEIKNAAYKGADSSIIKITSNGNEYWFNWNECWFLETTGEQ